MKSTHYRYITCTSSSVINSKLLTKSYSFPTGLCLGFLTAQYLVPWPFIWQCVQNGRAAIRSCWSMGSDPTHILLRQSMLQTCCKIFLACLYRIVRSILLHLLIRPDLFRHSRPSPSLREISSHEWTRSLWRVGPLTHNSTAELVNSVHSFTGGH